MRLGMIITQTDPETVFNGLRPALYSLEQGDEADVFLPGRGVEIDGIQDTEFDMRGQAQKDLDSGGRFFACGACLDLRNSKGSAICPLSTPMDHYEIVRDSDKLITI